MDTYTGPDVNIDHGQVDERPYMCQTLEQKVKVILYLIQDEQSTLTLGAMQKTEAMDPLRGSRGQECSLHEERCSPWHGTATDGPVWVTNTPQIQVSNVTLA